MFAGCDTAGEGGVGEEAGPGAVRAGAGAGGARRHQDQPRQAGGRQHQQHLISTRYRVHNVQWNRCKNHEHCNGVKLEIGTKVDLLLQHIFPL